MSLSQAKPITSLAVTLLAQQAFHDVMQQQLHKDPRDCAPGESLTYCIGDDDDIEVQADQIAQQFEALLREAVTGQRRNALPSITPSAWRQ